MFVLFFLTLCDISAEFQTPVIYFQEHLKFLMKWKYHFLVESKPHERIDLLITTRVNISQTKKEKKSIPTVMKTCFSEGKLMKQFEPPPPPPLLREPSYFSAIFLWPPSLSKFLKQEPPPHPLILKGGGGEEKTIKSDDQTGHTHF